MDKGVELPWLAMPNGKAIIFLPESCNPMATPLHRVPEVPGAERGRRTRRAVERGHSTRRSIKEGWVSLGEQHSNLGGLEPVQPWFVC